MNTLNTKKPIFASPFNIAGYEHREIRKRFREKAIPENTCYFLEKAAGKKPHRQLEVSFVKIRPIRRTP